MANSVVRKKAWKAQEGRGWHPSWAPDLWTPRILKNENLYSIVSLEEGNTDICSSNACTMVVLIRSRPIEMLAEFKVGVKKHFLYTALMKCERLFFSLFIF